MRDNVAQAHLLIGARLRDPQRRSMGRVVGVDQTRDPPALLIVWEGQVQAARVPLSTRELHELVKFCVVAVDKTVLAGDSVDEVSAVVEPVTRPSG